MVSPYRGTNFVGQPISLADYEKKVLASFTNVNAVRKFVQNKGEGGKNWWVERLNKQQLQSYATVLQRVLLDVSRGQRLLRNMEIAKLNAAKKSDSLLPIRYGSRLMSVSEYENMLRQKLLNQKKTVTIRYGNATKKVAGKQWTPAELRDLHYYLAVNAPIKYKGAYLRVLREKLEQEKLSPQTTHTLHPFYPGRFISTNKYRNWLRTQAQQRPEIKAMLGDHKQTYRYARTLSPDMRQVLLQVSKEVMTRMSFNRPSPPANSSSGFVDEKRFGHLKSSTVERRGRNKRIIASLREGQRPTSPTRPGWVKEPQKQRNVAGELTRDQQAQVERWLQHIKKEEGKKYPGARGPKTQKMLDWEKKQKETLEQAKELAKKEVVRMRWGKTRQYLPKDFLAHAKDNATRAWWMKYRNTSIPQGFIPRLKIPYGSRFAGMNFRDIPIDYLLRLEGSSDFKRLDKETQQGLKKYLSRKGDVERRIREWEERKYERDTGPGGRQTIEFMRPGDKTYSTFERNAPGDFAVSDSWDTTSTTHYPQSYDRTAHYKYKTTYKDARHWERGHRRKDESDWMSDVDIAIKLFVRRGGLQGGMRNSPELDRLIRQQRPGHQDFLRVARRGLWDVPRGLRKDVLRRMEDWHLWTTANEAWEDQQRKVQNYPGMPDHRGSRVGMPKHHLGRSILTPQPRMSPGKLGLDFEPGSRPGRGERGPGPGRDLDVHDEDQVTDVEMSHGEGEFSFRGKETAPALARIMNAKTRDDLLDVENDLSQSNPYWYRQMPDLWRMVNVRRNAMTKGVNFE